MHGRGTGVPGLPVHWLPFLDEFPIQTAVCHRGLDGEGWSSCAQAGQRLVQEFFDGWPDGGAPIGLVLEILADAAVLPPGSEIDEQVVAGVVASSASASAGS